jgi:hypothetical protein
MAVFGQGLARQNREFLLFGRAGRLPGFGGLFGCFAPGGRADIGSVLGFGETAAASAAPARAAPSAIPALAFVRTFGRWSHRRRRGRGRFHYRMRRGGAFSGSRRHVLFGSQHLLFRGARDPVVFFVVFEEVGNLEERVAFQPDVNESGLHARKHTRYAPFLNAPGQRVFVAALKIDLDQLVVFEDRHFVLVAAC